MENDCITVSGHFCRLPSCDRFALLAQVVFDVAQIKGGLKALKLRIEFLFRGRWKSLELILSLSLFLLSSLVLPPPANIIIFSIPLLCHDC